MILSRTTLGLGALLSAGLAAATQYVETQTYDATNFFDGFDFFSDQDPTEGFVNYVDAETANDDGLAGYAEGGVYLGVDYTNTTTTGRDSIRVTSKQAFTKGLFVADIAHMPAGSGEGGSCGLWPAFWMFGPNWPSSGEIDIIEGVNSQTTDAITLHTSSGCSVANTGSASSTQLVDSDCSSSAGCGQSTTSTNAYGAGFNAAGGGVYAVEWTSTAISVWFFPRNSTTATTLTGAGGGAGPDTSSFGQPLANFVGDSCDFDEHFASNNLVFNIDFCGSWAGEVWGQDATCSSLASTCDEYVGNNPQAFAEAYWLINSVKVYSQSGTNSTTTSASSSRRRAQRFRA